MDSRERVFIVGGGPSLKDFDFNLLRDEKTIGVNYAIRHIPNPSYFLTADSGVIQRAVEANFWGMGRETKKIVIMGPEHPRYKYVKDFLPKYDILIEPYRTDTGDIGFSFDKFVTGKNTGFCALQYAVLLRFREIFLMGFDLNRGEGGRKYFYTENRGTNSPYDVFFRHFLTGIEKIKEYSMYSKVYLSSRPSRLEPFMEYKSVEEVLS
jgi:hypothetical protein